MLWERRKKMKAGNSFAKVTAPLGRGLVYGYLYAAYRPKIYYQNKAAKEAVEKGGVIIVGNHVGHNDGQLFYTLFKNSSLIMAKDWMDKKILKWITDGGRFIPVDRFKTDITWIHGAADELKAGGNIIIFPEGHTSKTGVMDEFKPGFAMLSVMSGAGVVPVYNDGEYHPFFGRRLRLYVGEPMKIDSEGRGLNADYLAKMCNGAKVEIEKLKAQAEKNI